MKKALLFIAIPVFIITTIIAQVIIALTNDGAGTIQPGQTSSTSIILPPTGNEVEAKLNEFRTSRGLHTFHTENAILDQAAQARAEGMCAANDWSHNLDWATLNQYYAYQFAGENLYYGSLQENQAAKAITDWVNSPSHLANMVADYSEVGVGVKPCPGFQGNANAVIITNYFGVPR